MNELMHLGGLSLTRRRGTSGKKPPLNQTKKLREIARVVCCGVVMLCGAVRVQRREEALVNVEEAELNLLVGRGG